MIKNYNFQKGGGLRNNFFFRKVWYTLVQSSKETTAMQLGSKKVFLFYSVLCMLHVESDCGTNVKDSTYISCCLYQLYIVLFENSPVNLSSTTTDAFFNFRCNVVKMNCCRIASLKFFFSLSLLLFPFVCLLDLFFSFLSSMGGS